MKRFWKRTLIAAAAAVYLVSFPFCAGEVSAAEVIAPEGAGASALATPSEEPWASEEAQSASSEKAGSSEAALRIKAISLPEGALQFYEFREKPSLSELEGEFPDTLTVTLNDGKTVSVPVTWVSTEDYESSELHYLEFDPVPDGVELDGVELDDVELDGVDLPYIGVSFLSVTASDSTESSGETGKSSGNSKENSNDAAGTGESVSGSGSTSEEDSGKANADEIPNRQYSFQNAADNESTIYSFLTGEMKLNTAGACGILANIYAESSFNPQAEGDEGTSYGICQWHNDRKKALIDYCSGHGYDYTTLNGQLHYLQYEAEKDYPATLASVRSQPNTAEGAYKAGYTWCRWFEVPANTESTSSSRGRLARDVYFAKYYQEPVTPTVDRAAVQAFVTRLYQQCLGRNPDAAGLENWTNQLVSGNMTGVQAAAGFFLSKEFSNRKLSNGSCVDVAYRVFLNRAADSSGRASWVLRLDAGMSYECIVEGFGNSSEFGSVCSQYGIQQGTYHSGNYRDRNLGVTQFVGRCYTNVLGRAFDTDGLENWCGAILNASNRKQRAIEVATDGFFHSKEFRNRNVSNSDYVNILYQTFLGRKADTAGYNSWMDQLNKGKSRDEVMMGFAESKEFNQIMAGYGIR